MSDMTQVGSEVPAEIPNQGTTEAGQSSQSATAQPNDPQSFQADYTRKYQELSEQRRQFESERQAFESQRAQLQQNQGYYQQNAPVNPGYQRVDQGHQALIDKFGREGAEAILQQVQGTQQIINQTKFEFLYTQEELKGKAKYGEEAWNKFNYVDPTTGQTKNRIMDYRIAINPMNGKSLTLDEAWRAANPVDAATIEQQVREKVYAEINQKAKTTPASVSQKAPTSSGQGHAMSLEDAVNQAWAEHGLG